MDERAPFDRQESGRRTAGPLPDSDAAPYDRLSRGLSIREAHRRLERLGPNEVPEPAWYPLSRILGKFWAPVPWMLEAAIIFELLLGRRAEAVIIAILIVFNAALAFFQEGRAHATIESLKSRLALTALARRDGAWTTVAARTLVDGDIVKLVLGAVVPADVQVIEGNVLVDESMLTGESIPVEAGSGRNTYAGALVRRGEALAKVTATGIRTKFGRTAELVSSARTPSSEERAVVRVVRNLVIANGFMVILLVAYACAISMPFDEIVPLVLTAVLASIPVALPATFTLASALGAHRLAKQGVLPTRLLAVQEAATLDVLCSDKTGTLTQNQLSVMRVYPAPGFAESMVLALGALASSESGQDPVDLAVRLASPRESATTPPLKRINFVPFDPSTKTSEAAAVDQAGNPVCVVKGAYAAVAQRIHDVSGIATAVQELETKGARVLGVAIITPASATLAGIIALSDLPRNDSAKLINELDRLGVRTVMVTGDAPTTAMAIGRAVGIRGALFSNKAGFEHVSPRDFGIFAGVLPEDKYRLVKAFQERGHTVGMCGDGANDAPALRQAQMGIAVSTATDVAKSAAGIVLTKPGLGGIVAAVKEGRDTFERIFTYTLNSVLKKIVQVLLLVAGLFMTRNAILTPLQMVIVMVTNDFLTMSLTTDHVPPSPTPHKWRVGALTAAGIVMGFCDLAFCTTIVAVGCFALELTIEQLRTIAFVALVTGSQAMLYCIRDRRRWWSRPSSWLVVSSCADIGIVSTLAIAGIAMAQLPASLVGSIVVAAFIFGTAVNAVKLPLFDWLNLT